MTGFCEHGNESAGSIKDGEFLDFLSALSPSHERLLHELLSYLGINTMKQDKPNYGSKHVTLEEYGIV
jgi:hypothetical protein